MSDRVLNISIDSSVVSVKGLTATTRWIDSDPVERTEFEAYQRKLTLEVKVDDDESRTVKVLEGEKEHFVHRGTTETHGHTDVFSV